MNLFQSKEERTKAKREDEKKRLLAVFGERWGNRPDRFAAAKRLTDFPEPDVASELVRIWEDECLNGNGISEICRDTLEAMGNVSIEPLIEWLRRDPFAVGPTSLIAQFGTQRCREALCSALDSLQSRMKAMNVEPSSYLGEEIVFKCGRLEKLISQIGSDALAEEARLVRERDAAERAERQKWDEWRASGGANATRCPRCSESRVVFDLGNGRQGFEPNCRKCGFNFSGTS